MIESVFSLGRKIAASIGGHYRDNN